MIRSHKGQAALAVLFALAVLGWAIVCATGAVAAVPTFKAVSESGEVVFFETEDQLVPGDTDTKRDVYERYRDSQVGGYVTREVSLGPTGGNDAYNAQFEAANAVGAEVFFSTQERMVAEDTDRQVDIYMRDLTFGTTTLVTTGEAGCVPGCGNGEFPTTFAGINKTGTEVFFTTAERLAQGDSDGSVDLYVRSTGETTLVSTPEAGCGAGCGNGAFDVASRGISADGSHAYFATSEALSPADGDSPLDIYAHDVGSGATFLVSQGACAGCGNGGAVPVFDGSSENGDRVFFSSGEELTEDDIDSATDIYARDLPNGPTTLVSGGSEDTTANFAASSADGSHVFFTSIEGLGTGDGDGANDIYEWTEGVPLSLVTTSPCSSGCGVTFDAVSANSTEVLFNTAAPLSAEDQDARQDVYRQDVGGGEPVLVSRGEPGCTTCWNGGADVKFSRGSADASRVIFGTPEGILEEDTDGEDDIYLRDIDGESTRLITTSPSYCPRPKGSCGASFVGASSDGRHIYFLSVERFTLEDGDNEADIYERFLGESPGDDMTRLVSQENDPNFELGPPPPSLTGTDPESPSSSTTPRVLGEAEAGARVKIYATTDCSGEPVVAGTTAELEAPGLKASVTAGSSTEFRATAEAEGFVSKCSQPIDYRQIKEAGAEAPGGEAGGGGPANGGSGGGGNAQPGPVTGATVGGGNGGTVHAPSFLIPQIRITFAPASKTRRRSPVFRFTDSTGQPGTTFRCKLDRKPWKRCASPLRLKRLGIGRHALRILAVNGAGVATPRPVRRAFKVVPR